MFISCTDNLDLPRNRKSGYYLFQSLHKIPKVYLISLCGNFVETPSFRRVSRLEKTSPPENLVKFRYFTQRMFHFGPPSNLYKPMIFLYTRGRIGAVKGER